MNRRFSRTISRFHRRAPLQPGAAPDTVWDQPWDVAVLGGGNAALVSALTAADHGARVLLLERAPVVFRGGNSRHTRNVRCAHDAADGFVTGPYPGAELRRDLDGVGSGPSDEALADLTIAESRSVPEWMSEHGVRWQPALRGTLGLARTNRFFLGGGKALVNSYYRTARRAGITVRYEASVQGLEWSAANGGTCAAVFVDTPGGTRRVKAKTVIAASGGFEANIGWLSRYWGDAARNYHIRGPRYNDGTVLDLLLRAGAERAGEERGFHAVAMDARSPKFDGGIATRLDSIPFGIVVNSEGRRFYDEGEDIWPKRYAIWGGNIARQPGQIAYALWDSQVQGLFLPPMYGAYRDDTLAGLSRQLGLDPRAVAATVDGFNAAVDKGPRRRLHDGGAGRPAHRGHRPAEEQLGAAPRHAPVLRRPDAAGDHVHLPWRRRHRRGPRRRGGRRHVRQRVRRRGDHVGQHPVQRLPRRLRHDDRHGLGPDRRPGGGPSCPRMTRRGTRCPPTTCSPAPASPSRPTCSPRPGGN
jgi:tricarballylate dehydrogenase